MYDSVRQKFGDSNVHFSSFLFFYNMSILDYLYNQRVWITYFDYKVLNKHLGEKESQEFFLFIRDKKYIDVLDQILTKGFSIPCKKQIQKIGMISLKKKNLEF